MSRTSLMFLSSLMIVLSASAAQAQFDKLIHGIPESSNVLVIANVGEILKTPLAQTENWEANLRSLYTYGQTSIPPNTKLMLVAAEMDFEFVEPHWQVAMLEVTTPPDLKLLAEQQHGKFESVNGLPGVALPDDSYLVEFGTNIYGSRSPATRQAVSRWVAKSKSTAEMKISPYLTQAYKYVAEEGTNIVVALDLENSISAADVLERLEASNAEILKTKGLDKQVLSEVLASVHGAMLGVNSEHNGKVIVDFGKDVSMLKPFAKPLMLDIIRDYGAFIDEFEDWEVEVSKRRISLSGELGKSGRRRIMSFISVPAAPINMEVRSPDQGTDDGGKPEEYASQQYFSAVHSYLGEFRQKNPTAKTLGQAALWLDKYARKIDGLPMKDVYPEVRAYGRDVASGLREASLAYKGIGVRKRAVALEAGNKAQPDHVRSHFGGYRYGRYGWYGGYQFDYHTSQDAVQRARTEARAKDKSKGAQQALAIMKSIYELEGDVRNLVVDKYNVDLPRK